MGIKICSVNPSYIFLLSVNNVFGNVFNTDDISQKSTKTIQDVPVDVIYNNKDLHVTAPDNVDVNLSGPNQKLIKIENPEDLKVTIDLSDKKLESITRNFRLKV